jgi:hypothetical protein
VYDNHVSTGAVECRRVLEHPPTVLADTSMNEKPLAGLQNSGTDRQLRQELSYHQIALPAEDKLVCQVCNEVLTEGDPVTIFISRPAGQSGYSINQCRCREHNEDLTPLFTLGVRGLVVDGRVGQCRDHATQQAWPVLLAPSVRLLSSSDTTSGRVVSDSRDIHPNALRQRRSTDGDSNNRDVTSTCHLTQSSPNRDTSSDATEPRPAVERGDNEH